MFYGLKPGLLRFAVGWAFLFLREIRMKKNSILAIVFMFLAFNLSHSGEVYELKDGTKFEVK